MLTPTFPPNEVHRLEALRSLDILDTPPDGRFDRITRMAMRMFNVPIALVSLVDAQRQWFKSCIGLEASETPRDISFCGHAILEDETFVIQDATLDERFNDNPLVTGGPEIRFYAGHPLMLPDGSKIGTLCIISQVPRVFDADDRILLRDLARMVEDELAALYMATSCELTSLSNRRGFFTFGQKALEQCERSKSPAVVSYFDMDGFKAINDRFGHAEGDRALTNFAAMLMTTFRKTDIVGRLGGDEFVVLMTNCNAQQCEHMISRLRKQVDNYNFSSSKGYNLSFSMGMQSYDPAQHTTFRELIDAADEAMFQNKRQRKLERNQGLPASS